jgi:HD-GYP domain-containing protein (c-di-GMP phosphodiesterase class II)
MENLSKEEQLQSQLKRLLAAREIDQSILSGQNLPHTLGLMLQMLIEETHVDAAAFLLLKPYSQTLEYVADQGFRTSNFRQLHLRLGEDFAGQVALLRKYIHFADLKAARGRARPPWTITESFIAYIGLPLLYNNEINGVLEIFHRTPLQLEADLLDFLQSLANQAALVVDHAIKLETLQTDNMELAQACNAIIEGWARSLELRDLEVSGHNQRVTEMALNVARTMGVANKDLEHIRRGALLHDIGKIGISDGILFKPGPLTPEEWGVMRKHPIFARQLLSPIPFLHDALDIPYYHHERWDGTGYPDGLAGEEIPLSARIFAVIDVWDALRYDRPYHQAWSEEEVLSYIRQQAGSYFDPQVVEVFLKLRTSH